MDGQLLPVERWERELDGFDATGRRAALERLAAAAQRGEIHLPTPGWDVNLHAHTFFSFNAYGYSPSGFAWRARRQGLAAAGIVDFDVLDGVPEFLAAARRLALRASAGLETRVFVPPFADRVINSPGEPGIAYHMGVGFVDDRIPAGQAAFLHRLKTTAQERNRGLVERVNAFLEPAGIDYDRDVLPLTPAGNATERHICTAYCRRARAVFPGDADLAAFWSEKLACDAADLDLPEGPALQGRLRSRTMKRGGVGYVEPDRGSFPAMADTNAFFLACGALPAVTWLDGTSEGEQDMEALLDTAMATGAVALNIIPDRNFTAGVEDVRVANLRSVIALAESRHLPLIVGTEMNSPGNRFVDDFEAAELAPFRPHVLRGACILYAHTVLQAAAGMGYTSAWARRNVPDLGSRMAFYEDFGHDLAPGREGALTVRDDMPPAEVLRRAAVC